MDSQSHQPTSDELQTRLQALKEENLQLYDRNERLFAKVGYLEGRLGHLASSNTDLSCRLVHSQEDKLKISKELVDEKIQSNKMREHFEQETFELKNKVLNQDSVITELEMERDKLSQELQSAHARLKVGEKSGQDLTEEYATLRKSYQVLAQAHNKELSQSEQLGAELLALARAQDALRRQLKEQQRSVDTTTEGLHGELERVRALISGMSRNRVKPDDLAALDKEQKTLLGNQDENKEMLEKMRRVHQEQQKKLEEKVAAVGKEHQASRIVIRQSQQKLSEQKSALMFSQSQVKEVEDENSKLQLQVKELNQEYRARLVCYIQDLALYIDGLGDGQTPGGAKMRESVENMLRDVRSSYRVREEQLVSAARSYKKRLQKITTTHQAVLMAYRVQREQILSRADSSFDPGPPEASFNPELIELRDETERELHQLREDKARLEVQLQAAREQVAAVKLPVPNISCHEAAAKLEQMSEESWSNIRTQLKEITASTLVKSEKERALLLTRAAVAEAQVSELQDYIDNHLGRYKQEIAHLHRRHGKKEAGRCCQSANSALHE
ncbi:hypothetical protein JOB18_027036 [Solea senegalensis]|nr:coiled-coil domain-containing protein 78 [Solea senegalensis]XP_043869678.1 coiled-coil domain-containing protein 78 [Solea senegalensis]XP_043869679.1 coiled-coil domain-containing protein 78 [Solea senegalensis]KAG7507200.1 hypothetical protein JOB18_027036 [Solea senegalensis]